MLNNLIKTKSVEGFTKQPSTAGKSEVPSSKKQNVMSPIGRRDLEDLKSVLEKKRDLDKIIRDLEETKEQISEYKDKIKKLFEKSNMKETELKNYIANLNSKMYNYEVAYDSKIDDTHKNILDMIGEIQLKVKKEIMHTKKEMEEEVTNKFTLAEQKQAKLMIEKIEEQRKIFDKMSNVRSEIEKINKNFESVDAQCETLAKENESLRILMKSLTEDNESLKNKLKAIIKENNNIKKEINQIFKEDQDVSGENNNDREEGSDEDEEDPKEEEEKMGGNTSNLISHEAYSTNQNFRRTNTGKLGFQKSKFEGKNTRNSLNENNSKLIHEQNERLIDQLKDKIKAVKIETKRIALVNAEEAKQKNESQQLLQKCIEDLKFDINKVQKDINNFRKLNTNRKGYDSELNAKLSHLGNLEQKFKLLSFIYDNGFQTTKLLKKNKLFG